MQRCNKLYSPNGNQLTAGAAVFVYAVFVDVPFSTIKYLQPDSVLPEPSRWAFPPCCLTSPSPDLS
jgi:hypothetical protein